jgi:sugar phosphate isomerase/epimerase
MQISLITDEISADLETAFEIGASWGIRDFELRTIGNDRVPDFPGYQKRRLKELLEEYQARIVAISPGLFKCPFPAKARGRFSIQAMDHSLYQQWQSASDLVKYNQEELLPSSLEYAAEIGAKLVIIFSFERDSPAAAAPDEIIEILQAAAIQAEHFGLQLAVEVENGFWADSGQHTYDLISKVKHLHFKDVIRLSRGACEYAVEGQIDWAGQIAALRKDGYAGHLSIETHMRPRLKSAEQALKRLRFLIKSASEPLTSG